MKATQGMKDDNSSGFDEKLRALKRKSLEGVPISTLAHKLIQLGAIEGSDLLDSESPAYDEVFLTVFNAAVQYCDLEQIISDYLAKVTD